MPSRPPARRRPVPESRRVGARRSAPRIGVFGGTFDPPHLGHLALAEHALEQLGLTRVIFVPAAAPPHKRARSRSPIAHRLAMTRLAVRGREGFEVSNLEARRAGPSYTADTLRALAAEYPRAELVLLMGADTYDDFPNWREPGAVHALATLAVAARPGARRNRRLKPGVVWLDNPPLDVSSSALRTRARAGRPIETWVPPAVARYIARHRLYRGKA